MRELRRSVVLIIAAAVVVLVGVGARGKVDRVRLKGNEIDDG